MAPTGSRPSPLKAMKTNAPNASGDSTATPKQSPTAKPRKLIDPTVPLRSARHEAFAQHVAMGKSDAEAYRLAGFKGVHSDKRAAEVRVNQGVEHRIAHIRAQASSVSAMTKEQALQFLTDVIMTPVGTVNERSVLAQEVTKTTVGGVTTVKVRMPGKIEAIKILGSWCGWERGTEAERAAANALGGVAEMVARIRARK